MQCAHQTWGNAGWPFGSPSQRHRSDGSFCAWRISVISLTSGFVRSPLACLVTRPWHICQALHICMEQYIGRTKTQKSFEQQEKCLVSRWCCGLCFRFFRQRDWLKLLFFFFFLCVSFAVLLGVIDYSCCCSHVGRRSEHEKPLRPKRIRQE